MRSNQLIRELIENELDRRAKICWGSFAGVREAIGRRVGRILVTPNDTERYLEQYRGCWPPGETYWSQVSKVMASLEPIWYGDHWKQRWYLLRDLVPVTRTWRQVMRTRRFCSICHQPVDIFERRQDRTDNPTRSREFSDILIRRHFTTPHWELTDGRCRPFESKPEVATFSRYLEWYRKDRDPRQLCCSGRCEATRFTRWYGLLQLETTQQIKSENRYQKEQQWIREGRQTLKQVRQYLSQRA